MIKNLNRMNDYYFKYLMGSEKNKAIALDFINAVLANENSYFTDIIYVDKDEDPEHFGDKQSCLDVKGILNDGSVIELEMQALNDRDMSERSLYYWARMYGKNVKASEKYEVLKPAICVNVLGFAHLKEPNWRNEYRVINIESKKQLNNHMQLVFLELPKLQLKDMKTMSKLDLWGAYFARMLSDDDLKEVKIMAEALKAEFEFTAEEKEQWRYEQREKFLRDQLSRESRARAEGIEQERNSNMKANALYIHNMMKKLNVTAIEAMSILGMPEEEQRQYLQFFEGI